MEPDDNDILNVDDQYLHVMSMHPNPVGYLHEICTKGKEETPLFTMISSHQRKATTVFFMKGIALGMDASGCGSRKNHAKAVAAYKILAAKGHAKPLAVVEDPAVCGTANVTDSISSAPRDSNSEVQSMIENADTVVEVESPAVPEPPIYPAATQVVRSVQPSIVPPFSPNNPTLSINWILKLIGAGLLQIEYEEVCSMTLEQPVPARPAWKCRLMAEQESTIGQSGSKRQALRIAGELMHDHLLSLDVVRQKLVVAEEKVWLKISPASSTPSAPPGWSLFQHSKVRNRVAKGLQAGSTLMHDYYEESQWCSVDDRVALLATKYEFRYCFEPWPPSRLSSVQSEKATKKRKRSTKQTMPEDPPLLTLMVKFCKNQHALGFAGQGDDVRAAQEAALRRAERYFSIAAALEKTL